MTIPQYIFENTEKYSNEIALAILSGKRFRGITFNQLRSYTFRFAHELIKKGVSYGDKVALLSENRPEWVIADLAVQLIGAIVVPVHSVFQPKYIKHVVKDSGARVLIVSDTHLLNKIEKNQEELRIDTIIYFAYSKLQNRDEKKLFYFQDLIQPNNGEQNEALLHDTVVQENDTATIVYTSGTTGLPKGVQLSHKNILENIRAILDVIHISNNDRLLSFLPLSHIFERTAGYYTPLSQGASIIYASDPQNILNDISLAKPTLLVSVPRLFEKAYERIQQKPLFAKLVKVPLGKKLIKKIIKKKFGGAVRFCVSGGAALDKNIGEFFHNLDIPIIEGYGLTETSPVISCNTVESPKYGSCGKALANVHVLLSEDNELLVKGPSVTCGYYNLPHKTDEAFTKEGYFKTGDYAHIDKHGYIYITGRKKNIIVLSTGKNVQPETIETLLDASPYISQTMVVGEGKKMITALVVPEYEYCESQKIQSQSQLESVIQDEIDKRLADLPDHEKIKRFAILKKPFSIENDELTPTLKLKRSHIEQTYKKEIALMYNNR